MLESEERRKGGKEERRKEGGRGKGERESK